MRIHLLSYLLFVITFSTLAQEDYYYYYNSEVITGENIHEFTQDNSSVEKVEFKKPLSEKYNGRSFQYDEDQKKKTEENKPITTSSGSKSAGAFFGSLFQIIGLILVIALVVYIFYLIMNREGSWRFGRNSDKNVVQIKSVEEDIENVNIDKLIKQAIANKDYRLAVRYYYLNTLKFLAQKELIKYHPEKTNADYYNELNNGDRKEDFSYLSYIYNYIWYGEFEIDENKFLVAQKSFNDFKK